MRFCCNFEFHCRLKGGASLNRFDAYISFVVSGVLLTFGYFVIYIKPFTVLQSFLISFILFNFFLHSYKRCCLLIHDRIQAVSPPTPYTYTIFVFINFYSLFRSFVCFYTIDLTHYKKRKYKLQAAKYSTWLKRVPSDVNFSTTYKPVARQHWVDYVTLVKSLRKCGINIELRSVSRCGSVL